MKFNRNVSVADNVKTWVKHHPDTTVFLASIIYAVAPDFIVGPVDDVIVVGASILFGIIYKIIDRLFPSRATEKRTAEEQ